ncbi:hypothetical protein [Hymenobacter convexus]|uniref:hypothetical protein n=1 Tax=Hymenobacter sp. CA1UV-4 TaxID=3063782 RepID=UPI0027138840|nr:hypothetical protein [Hymenobacter sp. CA1UV-4]MDO7850443.1 hypothetical protein [Hymenobacter sp. CA1UV-4]
MPTSVDFLQLVYCASTITPAVGAGWCVTATPALVKQAAAPLYVPVPSQLVVAWA